MADGSYEFGAAPSPEELAGYPINNFGDAMRLIRLAGGTVDQEGVVDNTACTLLYQIGAGWVGFNGKHWDRDYGEELARRLAHKVSVTVAAPAVASILAAAHPFDKPSDIVKYIRGLGSSGSTSGMLRQAQSYLTVKIDAFDPNPMAINFTNGTLKVRLDSRGKLVRKIDPHNPADRITAMTGVAFDPDARCPLFAEVHRSSFQKSREEGDYFQRVCGYTLMGGQKEQAFFVCQGKGRDGKSTLLDAMRQALGGYAITGDITTFLETGQQSSSGPTPDLARLAGDRRYVVLSEPPKGAVWNERRLKMWTSMSPVPARDLNTKGFEYLPQGKLVVECNIFPKPKGDDDGFWRRIKVVLFRHQVPKADVDLELPRKIVAHELPGVINWMLDGLEDYLAGGEGKSGGLRTPKLLTDFVESYRKSSSPVRDWLDDCCVWGDAAGDGIEYSKELRANLTDWWKERGYDENKVPSARTLGDILTDLLILPKPDRRGLIRRTPIRLKLPWERERDHAEAAGEEGPAGAGGASGGGHAATPGAAGGDLPAGDYYGEAEADADDLDGRPFAPPEDDGQ